MTDRPIRDPHRGSLWSIAWPPALVAGLLVALSCTAWWNLERQERVTLGHKVDTLAVTVASRIDADLDNRIPALHRMVRTWEIRDGNPSEGFLADARRYLADVPGFQALEWADREFIVRRVVPFEGNEQARNLDLGFERSRRLAMERARDLEMPEAAGPIDLVQGGKGILLFFPVIVQGRFQGFLVAVLRAQGWLDHVLAHEIYVTAEDFRVAVFMNDVLLYQQPGWDDVMSIGHQAAGAVRFLDHDMAIRIQPTQAFIDGSLTMAPPLTGIFGILISLALGLTVFLGQKAGREARRAQREAALSETTTCDLQRVSEDLHGVLTRLNLATAVGKIGIWTWDIVTGRLTWDPQMFALMGIPPDVLPTFEIWKASLHPEDAEATIARLWAAVEGRTVFDTRFRSRLPSGEERHIRAVARVERDPSGKACFLTGINMDISRRIRREEELQKSEETTRLLLDSTSQPIYGIDTHGNCTFANHACLQTLGFQRTEQVIGQNMHRLIHHSHEDGSPMAEANCHIFQAFQECRGTHRDDEVLWRADGTSFQAEYWSHPQVVDGKAIGAAVLFTDISDRKFQEDQARHLATHDHLTGLPNVRLANDRLSMALGLSKRSHDLVAVMFLDLDGFKAINDRFGHDAGDEVLRQVAQRLLICLRATDTVARIGGDEFLVVAGGLHTTDDAAALAHKLIRFVAQPVLIDETWIPIGVSVGLALSPDHATERKALVKKADDAMYEAKKAGTNGFRFWEAAPGE